MTKNNGRHIKDAQLYIKTEGGELVALPVQSIIVGDLPEPTSEQAAEWENIIAPLIQGIEIKMEIRPSSDVLDFFDKMERYHRRYKHWWWSQYWGVPRIGKIEIKRFGKHTQRGGINGL